MYKYKQNGSMLPRKNLNKRDIKTASRSFPLEVFPPLLQAYVKHAHKVYGTSVEHLAAGILFATSAAIGRTHLLEVKTGFQYSGQLFIALVGAPGTNKVEALGAPLQPVLDREKQYYQDYQQQIAEQKAKRTVRKVEAKRTCQRILVQDIHPELIASIHQENLRGLALYQRNLIHWLRNFNKNNSQHFWSSAWSGQLIDLEFQTGKPIYLRHPYISVAGILRTSLLEELIQDKSFSRGLSDQLLWVWPDTEEKPDWTLDNMPKQLVEQYHAGFNQLLDLTFVADEQSQLIKLTEASRELIISFFNQERESLTQENAFPLSPGIARLPTHTARFCLLLQLLWWAFDTVEKDRAERPMVERAIQLTAHFQANSRKVFDQLIHPVADRLPRNKRKIYEALPQSFTTAQGLIIAHNLDMRGRTFKRWLKDSHLFVRVQHGHYEKVV